MSLVCNSKIWQTDNRQSTFKTDTVKPSTDSLALYPSANIAQSINSINIASPQHNPLPSVRNINTISNPEPTTPVALGSQDTRIDELSLECKIKDASMLTREQKLLFARLIFNAKEILFADSANSEVTKPEKASKWFEILMQLNSVGANIPDYKTIRDQEWSNMRRAVEKKVSV